MLFVSIFVFCVWKLIFKTKFVKPEEADLVTGLREIEEHEMEYYEEVQKIDKKQLSWFVRIGDKIFG